MADGEGVKQDVAAGAAKGATKGGAWGAVLGGARAALQGRGWKRTAAAAAAGGIALVCAFSAMISGLGEPASQGAAHVNDVSVNGSNTSGFVGAAEESGLGDQAGPVSEIAEEAGIPTVILYALVAPKSGPWRAGTDADVLDNARTVAEAVREAQAGVTAASGWDLSTGTVMCQGDQLVVAGDTCPSGVASDDSGAANARQVREAWVAALMAVEGLPAPRTGTLQGASDAPAPPEDLEGTTVERITQVATDTYGLDSGAVTAVSVDDYTAGNAPDGAGAASQVITVTTDEPLPLATTLASRYQDTRVAVIEAAGRSWTPEAGWTGLDAPADGDDPAAEGEVRVWACETGWGAGCTEDSEAEAEGLTRDQADALYSRALSWWLGTPTTAVSCTASSGGATVGEVTSTSGQNVTIGDKQAGYVAAIIQAGRDRGESDQNVQVALMTALTESHLQMYANSNVPESLSVSHDAVGSDHDSVGLFQQRPSAGWGGGDVTALMDAGKSAGFFFDALDAWQAGGGTGSLGEQAQAVQASAYPDRYAHWEQAASQLLSSTAGVSCTGTDVSSTTGWGYPLPQAYTITSSWDPARMHPVLGYARPHWGTDIGAPLGTAVLSATDGTVRYADCETGTNGLCAIIIDSTDGWRLRYLHVINGSFTVGVGDTVTRGQQVAQVGNTGVSAGAHLHVEAAQISLLGEDTMWCPFDAAYVSACPNPVDTFASHGVDLATGEVTAPAGGGTTKALEWARTKIGGPYVWGGTGPDGYDCSGLVQAAYATVGITLEHSAASQCQSGQVIDEDQAQAGDLVCWGTPAYHVALYNGQGGIVGAQNYRQGIIEVPLYGSYYMVRIQ
ncbi:peptidoglycan DD-metalloendopeptidase family protein [Actinomyces sp. 594]|uniref:NlpC/P60 family protein n=1 Tax=Actinomyces sp. 594 TaxID=2057793 RepID=UPI001C57D03B|nr:NlpC/P60 family protein [Actinomyces sp. 594]MBW3068967.1 peptidoglycan DD-metalloendopeptidase family protein [Actinomyces sp. 594]